MAKLVDSVVGLQMSSSLRGETFSAFIQQRREIIIFSSHKQQTERIKPREKAEKSPRDEVGSMV